MKTSEWCPHCGSEEEYEFNGNPVDECKNCGEEIVLCSMCNMYVSTCNDCEKGNNFIDCTMK